MTFQFKNAIQRACKQALTTGVASYSQPMPRPSSATRLVIDSFVGKGESMGTDAFPREIAHGSKRVGDFLDVKNEQNYAAIKFAVKNSGL